MQQHEQLLQGMNVVLCQTSRVAQSPPIAACSL